MAEERTTISYERPRYSAARSSGAGRGRRGLHTCGRREISSAHFFRCYDGRQMGVAAAIETFVTNKAGDAGSSCKAEDIACACSSPRRSCRVPRGLDGRLKGKSLQASGRCHEQSTNSGGDVCNQTTVQIVGGSRFRNGSPNDRPAGACRHNGKTLISF